MPALPPIIILNRGNQWVRERNYPQKHQKKQISVHAVNSAGKLLNAQMEFNDISEVAGNREKKYHVQDN